MAGPSLKLGVAGTGKETIDALNVSLERLKGNLSALKVAKPDLGSLDSLTAEFKRFRNEFVELAQGQKTALAELVEVLQSGMQKAARAAKTGAAELDQALNSAGSASPKSGINAFTARLMVGSAALVEAAETSGNKQRDALFAWKAKLMVGSAAIAEAQEVAAQRAGGAAFAWQAKLQVGSLKIQEAIDAAAAREEGAKFAWKAKMMTGSLALAEEQERAADKAASGALAWKAKLQVGSLRIQEAIDESNRREAAAKLGWQAKMMTGSLKIAEEQERAAAKAAEGASAWQAKLQVGSLKIAESIAAAAEREDAAKAAWQAKLQMGSLKIAESIAAAAEREDAAKAAWIAKMQVGSLKIAEEARLAAEREANALTAAADRIARAEAAYQARTEAQQLRTQVRARAQLDQGRPAGEVQQSFGSTAVQAAQAAEGLNALRLAHERAASGFAHGEPQVRSFTAALKDAHGAMRGLADGFGQTLPMFASIGTFLAGAALSNAFVQVVHQGSEVGHILEVIGTLGGNTAQEVGKVKESLLQLAAQGPFGPLEIAEAFKTLSLAGLNAKDQLSSIRDVLNFSVAGGISTQKAAEGLVSIGTAFGYTASGFGRVGDVISKAAAISMASVEDFTGAMKTASVVSSLYGVSLEDVATQIAQLTQIGIKQTAAGTSVRNFYSELTADSGRAARTIKQLGISITDTAGNVKGIIPLARELNDALLKYDTVGQRSIVKAISNERGGKDFIAVVEALRKSASNGDKSSELESFQKQITESYGFMAISAANLAVTAKNQMLSVVSSFKGALVSAFDAVEPTILVVSDQLRTAFASPEFKQAIISLASTVANLTVFLVEHAATIGRVIEAYIAWKVVSTGFTVFAQMGAAVRVASEALGGLAARQAAVAASTAAASSVSAIGVAAGGAARGLGLVARALPVIGTILSVVGVAWSVYEATSVKASVNAASASELANRSIVDNLNEQTTALRLKNDELARGKTSAEAAMFAEGQQAKNRIETQRATERQVLLDQLSAAKQAQDAYERYRTAPEGSLASKLSVRKPGENTLRDAQAALNVFDAVTQAEIGRLEGAQERYRSEAKRNSDLVNAEMERQKAATAAAGKLKFDSTDPSKGAGGEFGALSSVHKQVESELKRYYDEQQKLLDKSHAGKLLSDVEYQLKSEQLARAAYANETAELQRFITQSETTLARMNASGKKGVQVDSAREKLQIELEEARQTLDYKKQAAEIDKAGRANKETLQLTTDLAKLREATDAEQAKLDVELRYMGVLPEIRAAEEARVATEAKYAELLRQKVVLLEQVEAAERSRLKTPGDVARAERDGTLDQYQNEISRLRAEISRIQNAATNEGQRAAEIKLRSPEFIPTWRKNLIEWANVTTSMRRYWDEMVEGIIEKGRGIWDNFVKTGKLSFGSILDFVRDQMSKAVYEQLLAPYFASLGKKIADWTLGARRGQEAGKPGATDAASDAWDVITNRSAKKEGGVGADDWSAVFKRDATSAWDWVKQKAGGAWDWIKSAGSSLWDSITGIFKSDAAPAVESFTNSLSNATGGLGDFANSLVDSISSMFSGGGGGGGGAGDIVSTVASFFGFANGGAFTPLGQLHAFARGGVFNSPTLFQFANGGSFHAGVMGEAGPEAVMPLKRGANGSLGIVSHSGGGGGSSQPMNVIINAPAGTAVERQEQRDDGRTLEVWLTMAEKRAVAAVNKSIGNGGSVAQTLKAKGVSMTNGLPRRD